MQLCFLLFAEQPKSVNKGNFFPFEHFTDGFCMFHLKTEEEFGSSASENCCGKFR
ncbi:hypothetical protein RHMOL_Rhmol03G0155000 [Rhododendron molle]|uniref:Uncharacterized protein n=1 Tax=Rhododendron molle TaxID=49168 RepID=A0ACC0PG84_RHOML|nr:hypothetical protein RHMOL_Rhmol03G0155000 [Rhododendron molle]